MANSRAVISTEVGGVVDLLGKIEKEEENLTFCERGLRVSLNNPEGFYKGVMSLATSEKLRDEFGERGREFILSKYSKETLISNIKNLYKDLNNQ
jgi:glycosyltransferase involved in cell wall biosynthesis